MAEDRKSSSPKPEAAPGTAARRRTPNLVVLLYAVLLVLCFAMVIAGVLIGGPGGLTLSGLGALAMIVTAGMIPIALMLPNLRSESSAATGPSPQIVALLESINERMMVSDTAKRIAYRVRDREALRRAIQEDVEKGDLDAALGLTNEMVQTYGYRREGEELRKQILGVRASNLDRQVVQSIAHLEQMLARREWDTAAAEAKKIQQDYPDSPRVAGLGNRVIEAKGAHKHDLERQFLEAARRDDVETAMELLQELDHYLTEQEAAPLLEVARGVIGKKRQNLGVQFKLAIQDHEWIDALNVGEQIIREFPNTKMADEVHNMIDVLRERAAGQQEAARAQTRY